MTAARARPFDLDARTRSTVDIVISDGDSTETVALKHRGSMKSLRLIHHEISSDIGYGAQELVGLQPDIILTHGTPATVALQRETRTIPIAFATGSGPSRAGIV